MTLAVVVNVIISIIYLVSMSCGILLLQDEWGGEGHHSMLMLKRRLTERRKWRRDAPFECRYM